MTLTEPEKLTQDKLDSMTLDEIINTSKSTKELADQAIKIFNIYSFNMNLIKTHMENKAIY